MRRIIVPVYVGNAHEPGESIRCEARVCTQTDLLVLPRAWKHRLGKLDTMNALSIVGVSTGMATHEQAEGEVCGPVRIQIEGFRPFYGEVLFRH